MDWARAWSVFVSRGEMGADQDKEIPPWASSRAIWRERLGIAEHPAFTGGDDESLTTRQRPRQPDYKARQKNAKILENEGYTQREIAKILDCSLGQVNRMLREGHVDQRFVYFIQSDEGGLVKIGTARDPEKRLADCQMGSPVKLRIRALTPGGRDLEKRLHQRFGRYRRHGEWFEPCGELMQLIEDIEEMEARYDACGAETEAPAPVRRKTLVS